ncbi:hypothetical protein NPIL_366971 [Nephila pilipes]|uniref:Uncharacterized protein n=1 Tax=Nephila pilipes TaxID=299642 RepID=A0A8X6PJN8_NEPPI|nr:hypothetical protein NPIL_366971 [Nephila pilipes]
MLNQKGTELNPFKKFQTERNISRLKFNFSVYRYFERKKEKRFLGIKIHRRKKKAKEWLNKPHPHKFNIHKFFQEPEFSQTNCATTDYPSTSQLPLELLKEPSNQIDLETVLILELIFNSIMSFEISEEIVVKSTIAEVGAYLPIPDDPDL